MNTSTNPGLIAEIVSALRSYLCLCEEVLMLATRENQLLASPGEYQSFQFHQLRKGLLPRLESSFITLRRSRQLWQEMSDADRAGSVEMKTLLQSAQGLLMRILLLDRENQQALLRRGLVPATHIPSAAGQQPNYVASVYRRHLCSSHAH